LIVCLANTGVKVAKVTIPRDMMTDLTILTLLTVGAR